MNSFEVQAHEQRVYAMLPEAFHARVRRPERAVGGGDGKRDDAEICRVTMASAGRRGQIAVIPIHGAIASRAGQVDEYDWQTSYEHVGAAFDAVVSDSAIGGVILDVDSPGGMHAGAPELAARIRAARGSKPIVAYANNLMASAGYLLSSAADRIYATPTAMVGSVGVLIAHHDVSKLAERIGVKVTFIHAGRYKVEGNPFEALGDEARANLQGIVDYSYGQFVDAVSEGRGRTAADVRENFGQGRVFKPEQAKRAGMIDGVATVDQLFARLGSTDGRRADWEGPFEQSAAIAVDAGEIERRRRLMGLKARV